MENLIGALVLAIPLSGFILIFLCLFKLFPRDPHEKRRK